MNIGILLDADGDRVAVDVFSAPTEVTVSVRAGSALFDTRDGLQQFIDALTAARDRAWPVAAKQGQEVTLG